MRHIARHYVKVSGQVYLPGEVIDIPCSAEKRERLLRLGAIEVVEGQINAAEEQMTGDCDMQHKEWNDALDSNPAEEDNTESEAPEIDVMDGIISNVGNDAGKTAAPLGKNTGRGRKKA